MVEAPAMALPDLTEAVVGEKGGAALNLGNDGVMGTKDATTLTIGVSNQAGTPQVLNLPTVTDGQGNVLTLGTRVKPGVYRTSMNFAGGPVEGVYIKCSEWNHRYIYYSSTGYVWDHLGMTNGWLSIFYLADGDGDAVPEGTAGAGWKLYTGGFYDPMNDAIFTINHTPVCPGGSPTFNNAGPEKYYTHDGSYVDTANNGVLVPGPGGEWPFATDEDNPNPSTGGTPPTEVWIPPSTPSGPTIPDPEPTSEPINPDTNTDDGLNKLVILAIAAAIISSAL